jgi:hypothetical protein
MFRLLMLTCILLVPRTGLGAQAAASGQAPSDTPSVPPRVDPIRKNHFVPIFDIVAFDFLLNRFNYRFVDHDTYNVGTASIKRNATSPWVLDSDPFAINQFMHPYQGSTYHGLARSAGLNYWESVAYTFGGSLLWEIAGETSLPSRNDQIATGIGGTFLGETLFRLASRVLERTDHLPAFWRNLSAAIISPSTGFNRLVYGKRFRGVFPSDNPPSFTRIQFGMVGTSSVRRTFTQSIARNEAVADFASSYGLPGDPKYTYRRPFDYFNFQFTTSTGSRFENIFSRGLLIGKSYGEGADRHRGVWGLYGTYDYVSPQVFRISTTALGLGTTLQRQIFGSGAVQSTLLGGLGYGAGGGTAPSPDANDYHFGLTPQLLADVRVIPNERAAFDLTFRDYYVSRLASVKNQGSENIARVDALFSVRLKSHHAVSARYIWSRREAGPDITGGGEIVQSRGTVGLFYTYMHGAKFGQVQF